MSNRSLPLVIGIAGGTGSGKTTVANAIVEEGGYEHIALLTHDAYYKDLSSLSLSQRIEVNFDHPDSLDTDLLIQHIELLKQYQAIELPVYDFKTHTRTDLTIHIEPQ